MKESWNRKSWRKKNQGHAGSVKITYITYYRTINRNDRIVNPSNLNVSSARFPFSSNSNIQLLLSIIQPNTSLASFRMASSYLHRPCYDAPTIRPFILVSLSLKLYRHKFRTVYRSYSRYRSSKSRLRIS